MADRTCTKCKCKDICGSYETVFVAMSMIRKETLNLWSKTDKNNILYIPTENPGPEAKFVAMKESIEEHLASRCGLFESNMEKENES